MGKTFRASRSNSREPQKEEKEENKTARRKKSLQDACKDLKKAVVEERKEQERVVAKIVYDADYEALMVQMYGPQINPRTPLLEFEGKRIPKSVFEDVLIKTFSKQKNRLPITWDSEKDYLTHCLAQGWIEMDDSAVTILPVGAAAVKVA